jgi:hypothetical protein
MKHEEETSRNVKIGLTIKEKAENIPEPHIQDTNSPSTNKNKHRKHKRQQPQDQH